MTSKTLIAWKMVLATFCGMSRDSRTMSTIDIKKLKTSNVSSISSLLSASSSTSLCVISPLGTGLSWIGAAKTEKAFTKFESLSVVVRTILRRKLYYSVWIFSKIAAIASNVCVTLSVFPVLNRLTFVANHCQSSAQ